MLDLCLPREVSFVMPVGGIMAIVDRARLAAIQSLCRPLASEKGRGTTRLKSSIKLSAMGYLPLAARG